MEDSIFIKMSNKHVFVTPPLCKNRSGEVVPANFEFCKEFFIGKIKPNYFKDITIGRSLLSLEQNRQVILAGIDTKDIVLGIMCLSDLEKLHNYDPIVPPLTTGDRIQTVLFNVDVSYIKEEKKQKEAVDKILKKIVSNGEIVLATESQFPYINVFLLSCNDHISTIIYDSCEKKFYSFDSMGTEPGSHRSILPDYVKSMNTEKIQNTSFCAYITMKFCKELLSKRGISILYRNSFEEGLQEIISETKSFVLEKIKKPEDVAHGKRSDLENAITEIKENIEKGLFLQ